MQAADDLGFFLEQHLVFALAFLPEIIALAGGEGFKLLDANAAQVIFVMQPGTLFTVERRGGLNDGGRCRSRLVSGVEFGEKLLVLGRKFLQFGFEIAEREAGDVVERRWGSGRRAVRAASREGCHLSVL